jgi:hypothetical protein
VPVKPQAGERDGTRAPAEPTTVGARAERHEAARRGLRRRPKTGMGEGLRVVLRAESDDDERAR